MFILTLLISASINCAFFHQNTFTLKVKNAPVGSQVFLDGAPKGNVNPNGTLILESIEPCKHSLRIKAKDFPDYKEVISGNAGEVLEIFPAF